MANSEHLSTAPLVRLIYRSRSLVAFIGEDAAESLEALLEVSRDNNRLAGITGVLLYNGAFFLQAIEGKSQQVEALYEAIACDQRHEDIELIEFSAVDERRYPEWSMAFIDATGHEHEALWRFLTQPPAAHTSRLADAFFEAVAA